MCRICDLAQVVDYPWAELYGRSKPPADNEKTFGLARPSGSYQGRVDPTASGMAGPNRMKETEIRADVGVSFTRHSEPEASLLERQKVQIC